MLIKFVIIFFFFYFRLTKEQFALINVSNLNNTLYIFIFHFTVGYRLLFLYCSAYKDCIEKMKKRYHYTQSISFLYTTKNDFIINPIIKPNGVWNTKVQIPLGLIFYVVIFLFMHTYFLVILHINCANLYFFHLQYWYRTLFCLRLLRIGARPWESEKRKIV